MEYFFRFLCAITFLLTTEGIASAQISSNPHKRFSEETDSTENREWDNPNAQAQYELMRLRDPKTGMIPPHIHQKELQFASHIPTREQIKSSGARTEATNWVSRGPYNIGGRTRAVGIDVNDTNIILAGGVSGGMWRSTDGGSSWTRTTPLNDNPSVSCLVQDTRPGKTNTWYYGSGEYFGNSAGVPAVYFAGEGIFKSTDDGQVWSVIPSTYTDTESYYEPFSFIFNIAVVPSNLNEDILYAATTEGIMRSSDGGTTWKNTLKNSNLSDFETDVEVSFSGVVYATINSRDGKSFFRSTDGINWTDISPTGWDSTGNIYFIFKIGISPSNENVVYFLSDAGYFWKYSYLSGDGSGSGGKWENRTSNLQNFGSQGGYDLFIKVKPDNANTVIFGGLYLYCTTDGLATSANLRLLGPEHFDQQTAAFMPSNPQALILGNDGGLSYTSNDTLIASKWTTLNNGYFTSQFFTVGIDHSTHGSETIIGGMQDNGTAVVHSTNGVEPWSIIESGDGGPCAITDSGRTYYYSYQYGITIRGSYNSLGMLTDVRGITPFGTGALLFENPYAIDPNNSNIMYFARIPMLWRNDSLSGIPNTFRNNKEAFWDSLPGSNILENEGITAISVSSIPANRVYYGTQDGKIFRLDSANKGNPLAKKIMDSSFLFNGYVNCIAIDPLNADNAIVVFSNYDVQSLFYTTNGGTTWTPIGGNLEEHPDGSGNGPSCRWASILHVGNGTVYLVGTSTGLYSTTQLNSMSTVWAQEGASTIGNAVVDMMDVRQSDGFIAVATHGNGIFSGYITSTSLAVDQEKQTPFLPTLVQNYPNPFSDATSFSFTLPESEPVQLRIYNILGETIATAVSGRFAAGMHDVQWNANSFPPGLYYYSLQAGTFSARKSMMVIR